MNYYHFAKDLERRKESVRYYLGGIDPPESLPVSIRVGGITRWLGDIRVERACSGVSLTERVSVGDDLRLDSRNESVIDPEMAYPEALVVEQATAGNALFTQNGREYLVNPGDVFLLQMRCGTHVYRTGPAGVLYKRFAEIRGPLLPSLLRTMGLIDRDIIRPDNPGAITAVLRRIYALLEKKEPQWPEKLSLSAYELLLILRKNLPPRYPPALITALTYIERNLGRRISHQDLCRHTGLSTTHLCRIFKQHTGLAPVKYLTKQKMTWAQRLLVDTAISVKEVAATVGFDDQLYFSAQFKHHLGVSPSAYRTKFHIPDSGSAISEQQIRAGTNGRIGT